MNWVAYNYKDELTRAMFQIKRLTAVVEAAEHYVHWVEAAHHADNAGRSLNSLPLKKQAHKNLIDEVHAYQEDNL